MPDFDSGDLEVRWLGRVGYEEGLELQNQLVSERSETPGPDRLLLLEHDPVYTIGRTPDQSSLIEIDDLPHPVVETNRGGQATYHGPGQLVAYPILDLRRHGQDLHALLRFLEEVLLISLRSEGVEGRRSEGQTGVWVGDRKIASIGVGVRRWISMHGFAINVTGDLAPFHSIVPCGIDGVEMTSLEREWPGENPAPDVESFGGKVAEVFQNELGNLKSLSS